MALEAEIPVMQLKEESQQPVELPGRFVTPRETQARPSADWRIPGGLVTGGQERTVLCFHVGTQRLQTQVSSNPMDISTVFIPQETED